MPSGVGAGVADRLKAATANVIAQRTPTPPAANPFNGSKLAEYRNSQTSGNLSGTNTGTWSAKVVPNAPKPAPVAAAPQPAPVSAGAPQPSGIGYNPNNIFTPGSNGGYDPAAQEKAYLQMQVDALNGQSNAAKLAANYGVDQNKAYLTEQLGKMQQQNAVDNNGAQQLQNRRGGFYSGGLDTQLSSIGSAYADQQGGLTRDVGARNQQLLDQYGNQANAISQQIQQLQSASPDILRERIQSWINNERQYGLDYAGMFGNLNGQNTQSQNNQDFNQQFARDQFNYGKTQDQIQNDAQYGGTYNGNQTAQQQQQAWQNRFDYGNAIGQFGNGQQTSAQTQQDWQNRFNYGNAIGQFGNGQKTVQQQQNEYQQGRDSIGDQQWQQSFDRGKYESDRNYQQQVQQQAISSGQWQQQFNQDVQKMGFDQASQLWNQAFQQNQAGQDDAYRKQTLEQEMTQQDRSAASQATSSIKNSGLVSTTVDPVTGQESMSVSNPSSLNNYIKALNLSDNATDALLYQYGLDSYVKK